MPISGAAPLDFTVTSEDARRVTRSLTLRLALPVVGAQTPSVQLTFFVFALEIVSAACALVISAQEIAAATVSAFVWLASMVRLLMFTAAGWPADRASHC